MKINLTESVLKEIDQKIVNITIKIVKIKNDSTIISIKGHQIDVPFDVPFVLNRKRDEKERKRKRKGQKRKAKKGEEKGRKEKRGK